MYPLSDKDLDRLSREAAEQYDVESSASGWEQVEKKLNKVMPEQKERKRRFAWLLLLLVFLAGSGLSGILYFSNREASSQSTNISDRQQESGTIAPQGTVSTNDPSKTEQPVIHTAPGEANNASANATPSNTNKEKTLTGNDRSGSTPIKGETQISHSGTSQSNTVSSISTGHEENISAPINSRSAYRKTKRRTTTSGNTQELTVNGNPPTPASTQPSPSEDTEELWKHSLPNFSSGIDRTIRVNASKAFTLSNEMASIKRTSPADQASGKNKYRSPLAIGLVMGTDQSRIHGTSPGSLGWSGGISLQYDLTKRLAVQTGFTITKKFYRAAGKDFNPPLHYWTSYVNLQSVIGDCQMWDLPVQLRYDLYNKKSSRLFATAGASNYIMRNQRYEYHYLNSNNIPTVKEWETYSQSNYWFGVMNLSAGIEKQLSNKISFQVEPYVKLPLKGVGFGNMDISSYGVLLSLRYRPAFKKH